MPSLGEMECLTECGGLYVEQMFQDSSELQFFGSDQIQVDVPFNDSRTPLFGGAESNEWRGRADELNACSDGDHAVFILRA